MTTVYDGITPGPEVLTAVSVLGTLAEFHTDPLPYDLEALITLVQEINPDLLCLDITLDQWQQQDFGRLSPEYAQALLPLAAQTDIVVVPIGGTQPTSEATTAGWRGAFIHWLRRCLAWIQRTAASPDAFNQGWRHELGNLLYHLIRQLSSFQGQQAYHQRIDRLARAVVDVARRNPGDRILVVTNIQYCHHIRPLLRQESHIAVKPYTEL